MPPSSFDSPAKCSRRARKRVYPVAPNEGQMEFKDWKTHTLLVIVVLAAVGSSMNSHVLAATVGLSRTGKASGALAAAFRLRGAAEPQQRTSPGKSPLDQRPDISTTKSHSQSGEINAIADCRTHRSPSALPDTTATALMNRLMQGGAGLRRRGLLSFMIIACVLSIVRATTSDIVSRSWGSRYSSSVGPNAVRQGERGVVSSSTTSLWRRNKGERRRRLLKTPRFPLAHIPWWTVLKDRHKEVALKIGEGVAVEDHQVTKRAEGAQIFRAVQFWGRSATIYLSYKKMQAKCALELPRVADLEERELKRKAWWDEIHELNSDRMLKLCLDLRGFYLKSGQFLGTRHDFMPKIFLQKLGKLHDDVPPMSANRVSRVLSRELEMPANELFSSLNLTHPVGSASISQVHRGVVRDTGEKVAVKVQYPGAERVMMSDLRNLKVLAWFLQKFELNFDILSSLKELSKQIKGEFDFRLEAATMDRMHLSLGKHSGQINLPKSRLATKRVLIMSYLEGESLAQLKRGGKARFKAARKRMGKKLLHELADAWGHMIFQEGLFNADPHPGNILIMPEARMGPIKVGLGLLGIRTPKLQIGLLDWGQIKELTREDREKVANLILAVSSHVSPDIVKSFHGLGVKLSDPDDADSVEKLALVMFDTRTIKGLDFNPFSDNNVLKLNSVQEYPQDLYFILRTVLMFRGMAQSLGVEFSIADKWSPYARRLLDSAP